MIESLIIIFSTLGGIIVSGGIYKAISSWREQRDFERRMQPLFQYYEGLEEEDEYYSNY